MHSVRSLFAGALVVGLGLGSLGALSGCGETTPQGGQNAMVKDAPLPSDQQKNFDANYKKTPAKAGETK